MIQQYRCTEYGIYMLYFYRRTLFIPKPAREQESNT